MKKQTPAHLNLRPNVIGNTSSSLPAPLIAQALERTQVAKYHTKGGHGFSAEDANHFADLIHGKQAEITGVTNELNGADRVVNGLRVQSKYFQTAAESVASAFDQSSGMYRYTGQVLEVPKDQYEASIEFMRNRISSGKVPGFDNPSDAEKLVQQGTVTYKQARNIARAGNVDSLIFDTQTQAVTSSYVFALSFAITYAQNRWRGENQKDAVQEALGSAIAAGGTTLVTGVVSAQILRTKMAAFGVVAVRSGVKSISGTNIGREAVHRIAAGSLGKAVYGAAAINHVSKLLRSNAVTSTIAAVATSTPDFYRAVFARSISWRQFTKNVSINVAGVAAGTAGWIGGAAAGAAIGSAVPILGTAVGGIVGGIAGALAGGMGGSTAAKFIGDKIADDDSKTLILVLKEEIESLCFEYLLTEEEIEQVVSQVNKSIKPKFLRRMYQETRKNTLEGLEQAFARSEFEHHFDEITRKRPIIALPSIDELAVEVSNLVEVIAKVEVEQAN